MLGTCRLRVFFARRAHDRCQGFQALGGVRSWILARQGERNLPGADPLPAADRALRVEQANSAWAPRSPSGRGCVWTVVQGLKTLATLVRPPGEDRMPPGFRGAKNGVTAEKKSMCTAVVSRPDTGVGGGKKFPPRVALCSTRGYDPPPHPGRRGRSPCSARITVWMPPRTVQRVLTSIHLGEQEASRSSRITLVTSS